MGQGIRLRSRSGLSGQGQLKPEQQEIERLRREVNKLKAERDILKKATAFFAKEAT
jgi:transposase